MNIYSTPESQWPLDLPSAVFFARAVARIGAAMFDEWTGREAIAALESPVLKENMGRARMLASRSHPALALRSDQAARALSVLRSMRTAPLPSLRNHRRGGGKALSADEFEAEAASVKAGAPSDAEILALARAEVARHNVEHGPAAERFDAVCRAVVERCLGPLATYYRDQHGEMVPLPAAWWNLTPADWSSRFTTGQVNRAAPMRNDSLNGGRDRCWLYVDVTGLEAWESTLTTSTPTIRRETDALRALLALCADAEAGRGMWPKGVEWKPANTPTLTGRGAERVWAKARAKYPHIGTSRKPRTTRDPR